MQMNNTIYLGNGKVHFPSEEVSLDEVRINNEAFYKISNVSAMQPFFMSIVSNSNHWMFVSSNGGLTAGRKNSDFSLFPYYTDDKITESTESTGSKTIFIITKEEKSFLWEPFSNRYEGAYKIERNLYKNAFGNKVLFEEINHDLGVTFTYEWNTSNQFGFIRKTAIKNITSETLEIKLMDGLQNLLPYGVGEDLQKASSNLVDAYKKSELHPTSGLGIYSLSAIIVDRAEPSEALKANVVWSHGLNGNIKTISSEQLNAFRQGINPTEEVEMKAKRGAYFLSTRLTLHPGETEKWRIVADVNKSITDIVALEAQIGGADIIQKMDEDIANGNEELLQLVGAADGLQLTNDQRGNDRHFANTMFNIMRGGIFDNNYLIEKEDFLPYIKKANKEVFKLKENLLNQLSGTFTLSKLMEVAEKDKDVDFSRLCFEYLPLKFSRRHGDPSRPWNKFSINTQDEISGAKVLDYQGNWRDIFQNWEALAHAYPNFIQGMIHKFLNATTFDGYNPYRVTKDGFDWETIEPNNPWAYIGYWGDHQIIYLQKFLEFIEKYYPGKLNDLYAQECFVYAHVPYRIKPYQKIIDDPKNTIIYDYEAEEKITAQKNKLGADGALLRSGKDEIYQVTFIEKLLSTLMAKLSNFIPEAGIWMNTQRPEWNDANNALVGNGVSLVTLYYLRRFIVFFKDQLIKSTENNFAISKEMITYFDALQKAFIDHQTLVGQPISNTQRKSMMDVLGEAASVYRETIYNQGFSGNKENISKDHLGALLEAAQSFLEDAIDKNQRTDGLYHAYNLISIENNKEVSVDYLSEMLEGQVAVLSSGYLDGIASLAVLDSLRASKLYRTDQESYTLYPNKELATFKNKNNLPGKAVASSNLLKKLVSDGHQEVLSEDIRGEFHFNGNFKNADDLKAVLKQLPKEYHALVAEDENKVLAIFEEVFNHKAFTGRSGTFFGYEGLGSIYWHMVSKLSLAAYEVTQKAIENNQSKDVIEKLKDHYYEIVAGIGAHKSPEVYGAFPSDPYSHTPATKGAQQPGMTGQVKEDILSRLGEIGVRVEKGELYFDTVLLKKEEFLEDPRTFSYYDVTGIKKTIELSKNHLAFTYCQVPIIYQLGDKDQILIKFTSGDETVVEGSRLDQATSQILFNRDHIIEIIHVKIS